MFVQRLPSLELLPADPAPLGLAEGALHAIACAFTSRKLVALRAARHQVTAERAPRMLHVHVGVVAVLRKPGITTATALSVSAADTWLPACFQL